MWPAHCFLNPRLSTIRGGKKLFVYRMHREAESRVVIFLFPNTFRDGKASVKGGFQIPYAAMKSLHDGEQLKYN